MRSAIEAADQFSKECWGDSTLPDEYDDLLNFIQVRDREVQLALLDEIEQLAQFDSPKWVGSYDWVIKKLRENLRAELQQDDGKRPLEAVVEEICGNTYDLGHGMKPHVCMRPKGHDGEHAGQAATW